MDLRRRGNWRLGGGGDDDNDGDDGHTMGGDREERWGWRVRRDRVSMAGEGDGKGEQGEGEEGEGWGCEMDEKACAGRNPPQDEPSGYLPGHLRI